MARKITTEEFIKKAIAVHVSKYDYSFVEYINTKTKVKIICPIHGVFEKAAGHHNNGQGCLECSREKLSKMFSKGDDFVKNAAAIHGDKYDYSMADYKNNKTKVVIICKKHGEFLQTPDSHLAGRGCPMCVGKYNKKYYKNGIPIYETYHKRLESIGIKCKVNTNDRNVLEVACYSCGKFYIPNMISVENKIGTISGRVSGGQNMYCSDICKHACPVYYFDPKNIDPRSKLYVEKTEVENTRRCQTDTLKKLQCDENGYNYCEKCGDIIDVELHHTLEVAKHGSDAINSAGHILLCAMCHTETHEGCK